MYPKLIHCFITMNHWYWDYIYKIKERYFENDYINITSKLINQNEVQKYTYATIIKLLESMIDNNQLDEFDK